MKSTSMDITIHCDDLILININISDITRAREVIHQVVSSRRLMSPSVSLDFDDCIISIDDSVRVRLLSRESIVLLALAPKDEQSPDLDYKITASGFRAKAIQSIQSAGKSNYLIEKKTLELRYLLLTSGSNEPSDMSSPSRLVNFDACEIQDDYIPRSGSSSSSSSSNSSHSDNNRILANDNHSRCQTSFSNFLLQKYLTFSTQVEQFLAVEKTCVDVRKRPTLDAAEVFLNQKNLPQLFVIASYYDAENIDQILSSTESGIMNATQSAEMVDQVETRGSHEVVPQNIGATELFATKSKSDRVDREISSESVARVPASAVVVQALTASEVLNGERSSDDDSSSSSYSESEESSDEEEQPIDATIRPDVTIEETIILPTQSAVTATADFDGESSSSGSDDDEDSSDEETEADCDVVSQLPVENFPSRNVKLEATAQDMKAQGIEMLSAAIITVDAGTDTAVVLPLLKKSADLVSFKGTDNAEVETEGKREIQNAESSSSDSADDSGDDTESEADLKQVSAPTPVLFESKMSNSKTPEGGQAEGSSSSDSDSDNDSSDDDDEESDDGQDLGRGVGNVTDFHKIAPKLIASQEEGGGSNCNSKVKSINVFGLSGQENGCHNDRDADDASKLTIAGYPVSDLTTTAMPFTQEPLSCNIKSDCETVSDKSNIGRTLDDINNRVKDITAAGKDLTDDQGSILSDSVAHSVQTAGGKLKPKTIPKSIESSVDTTKDIKIKTLKTSDSDSSSSSGDDDSDDESSVDYQPVPKKPPLALMQLLFKKPTAKFPSCFLPVQKIKQSDAQKRKSSDGTRNEGVAKKLKKQSN